MQCQFSSVVTVAGFDYRPNRPPQRPGLTRSTYGVMLIAGTLHIVEIHRRQCSIRSQAGPCAQHPPSRRSNIPSESACGQRRLLQAGKLPPWPGRRIAARRAAPAERGGAPGPRPRRSLRRRPHPARRRRSEAARRSSARSRCHSPQARRQPGARAGAGAEGGSCWKPLTRRYRWTEFPTSWATWLDSASSPVSWSRCWYSPHSSSSRS